MRAFLKLTQGRRALHIKILVYYIPIGKVELAASCCALQRGRRSTNYFRDVTCRRASFLSSPDVFNLSQDDVNSPHAIPGSNPRKQKGRLKQAAL
jgi:hypothetical protein